MFLPSPRIHTKINNRFIPCKDTCSFFRGSCFFGSCISEGIVFLFWSCQKVQVSWRSLASRMERRCSNKEKLRAWETELGISVPPQASLPPSECKRQRSNSPQVAFPYRMWYGSTDSPQAARALWCPGEDWGRQPGQRCALLHPSTAVQRAATNACGQPRREPGIESRVPLRPWNIIFYFLSGCHKPQKLKK